MKSRFFNLSIVFALALSLLGGAMTVTPALATGTCFVKASASGSNNGTSWTNAYTSLQSAIADSCTEIWVAAGTYKPHASTRTVSFVLETGTAIYGGFAGTETLLSQRNPTTQVTILSGDLSGNDNSTISATEPTRAENSYHVIKADAVTNTAILDGFTISGGNANGSFTDSYGGGMFNINSSTPTISNVTFSNNSASFGGGVFNDSSTPSFTNVTFSGNSASTGGGMNNNGSSPSLTKVTFSGNSASTGGGMNNNVSSPSLTNVTFSGNSAMGTGGGMNNIGSDVNNVSNPILTNVTFSGNSAGSGGGMYNSYSGPTLKNVIIANSTGGDCVLINANSSIHPNSSNILIESTGENACLIWAGYPGSSITGSDPSLGSLTGSPAYFPLNVGSLAINAGTNTGCPATDQRGVARPQGSTCDIGAIEANATLYAKPSATGTGDCFSWANACTLQTAISLAISGDSIWVMQGTHKPHASDRTVSFSLKSDVAIYGGFAGTETLLSQRNSATNITILSGDLSGNDSGFTNNSENSYHVVTATNVTNTAILDGFTIKGGNANASPPDHNGGGMYNLNSNPTLNAIIFQENSASDGGGLFNENSSPTLTSITFNGNLGINQGGGVSNFNSNPTFTDSTFINNSAMFGGGMVNTSGSSNLLRVTFNNNSATFGGGIYGDSGTTQITNSTFAANSGSSLGGAIYIQSGTYYFVNNTFSANTSGASSGTVAITGGTMHLKNNIIANSITGVDCYYSGGTISTNLNNLIETTNAGVNSCGTPASSSDPLLGPLTNNGGSTETFALQTGSPAIDAGDNATCDAAVGSPNYGTGGLDQRGTARPQGSTCDVGAFEKLLSHTVTFNANGGSGSMSDQTASSPTALTTNVFTRTGYSFSGWNTAVNGSGTSYANGASYDFSADITLYAQWTIATTTLIVKSASANDGWILESTETSNTGGTLNSAQTTFILGDDAADKQYRAILHFDTSALPDTAVVTNITLKIKQQGSVTGTSPFTFGSLYVDMRNPAFGASALELADFNSAAKKVKSAIFNPTPASGWFSARFNNGGKLYINRTGVSQLRLYFSVDDNNNNIADFIRFFSGNAAAGDRPKLLITYTLP